ncbi:MAG: cytochrome c biogenesis protein CcsA [Bacteroidota bacterium]
MTGGMLGELFTALAFASSGVSMVAYFLADRKDLLPQDANSWSKLGTQAFIIHIISVVGVIATLFGLIYTHQYQYHYVWAHSSNELPVYYMISCFWEGQEGSFLLWSFWHSILAIFVMRRRNEWRNSVMGVIASVELILSSMILGIYINESLVTGIFILAGLLPAGWLAYRYAKRRNELTMDGSFHLLSLIVAAIYFLLLFGPNGGFQESFSWGDTLSNGLTGYAFALATAFVFLYGIANLVFISRSGQQQEYAVGDIIAGLALFFGLGIALFYGPQVWKVGSTPFTLLSDTFPDDPIYKVNPDFSPTNGTGLNPLLQNYWMVIHPPTLFLGFASTVIPFAYVMAGLFRGKYKEWIRPAMPWVTFSVLILGVGIIMGGYWAYETLNFGGYWNWDPVENSSFVPWLCGVASLHAMLIYRKTKGYLGMTMLLIIFTFLLVLLSTFLTRSGILGETSVHTFTDLGLSGQLLILLFGYITFVLVSFLLRYREIPRRNDEAKVWSAEFMLFLGTLVFIFGGGIILFATCIPVFNAVLGTNMAPPPNVQLFYYQWTVWFAILFGIVSGLGQFLWWHKAKAKPAKDALFRPFLLAMLSGTAVLLAIWYAEMDFAYDELFADLISEEGLPSSFLGQAANYLKFGILGIADELLLFSSLFVVFANTDILLSLVRKNRKGLKVMGGTIVHIGFGLMLLGMLFSSGYDQVISTNPFPGELSLFPEDEKADNIALPKGEARPILGYNVTYLGRKRARTPVEDLRILEANAEAFKLAFEDQDGETYSMLLPRVPFLEEGADIHPTADLISSRENVDTYKQGIDLPRIERSLNRSLAYYADQINGRTDYGLKFQAHNNPKDMFMRYTESEMGATGEGILPHPARKVYWNRDIYFYTSSLPNPDSLKPRITARQLQIGDTINLPVGQVKLLSIGTVENPDVDLKEYDLVAQANLEVIANDGRKFEANPLYLIKGRQPDGRRDIISEMDMEFAFMDIKPAENSITMWVSYLHPEDDLIVLKAISKPFINLLWLGTFILTFGFLLSIYRRVRENKHMR